MEYIEGISLSEIDIEDAPENKGLQESLNLRGQRQPVRLWQYPTKLKKKFKYQVVDGRRRIVDLIALKQLTEGKDVNLDNITVNALVYSPTELNTEDLHLDALTLNSGKPNEMDEADHIHYLIQECGYSLDEVAGAVGFSTTTAINRFDLKDKLLPEYQESLRSGKIKVSAAYNLNQITREEQKKLFDANTFKVKEIRKGVKKIRDAKKDLGNETMPPGFGADDPPKTPIKVIEDLLISGDEMVHFLVKGGGVVQYEGKQYHVKFQEIKKE